MASIPDFLQAIIQAHLAILLAWFSDYVYQRLAPKNHPLTRLAELVDFAPLESACAGFHKQNGMGRPVVHPVSSLIRAIVVRYFYDHSLRQTETAIHEQIPVKHFVGCPLHSLGISYSTLHRFETYLWEHHPRLFFDTVLRQILAAFPGQRLKPQIADTFAMLANAQKETLIGRLRHAAARLLLALHQENPAQFYQLSSQLDLATLVGPEDERPEFLLKPAEKEARLTATVAQMLRLLAQVQPNHEDVRRYQRMLQAVLDKEIELTFNDAGQLSRARQLEQGERGTYRPTSATDPDATIRNHGKSQDNGYNIHLAATTDFIIEIQAATGSQPDAEGIVPLLEAEKEHHDLRPGKLIYDKAAGHGKTIAAVAQASDGQTKLVVKPVQAAKKKDGDELGPLDCRPVEKVDQETEEIKLLLVCAGGQMTTIRYRSGSGLGWTYRMPADQCAGCPLFARCRRKVARDDQPRQWFISDHHLSLLEALAYAETEAFKLDMKLRPEIERIIAALVLHGGARHARFRGLEKVDFQAKMSAMAYNLKRWLNLSDPAYKTRPRRTAAQAVLALAAG